MQECLYLEMAYNLFAMPSPRPQTRFENDVAERIGRQKRGYTLYSAPSPKRSPGYLANLQPYAYPMPSLSAISPQTAPSRWRQVMCRRARGPV